MTLPKHPFIGTVIEVPWERAWSSRFQTPLDAPIPASLPASRPNPGRRPHPGEANRRAIRFTATAQCPESRSTRRQCPQVVDPES
jgi:hypothetical protein